MVRHAGAFRGSYVATIGLLAALCVSNPGRAAAEGQQWVLALAHSDRTCKLTLGFDTAGAAGALAMPAGCRRALPILREAMSWTIGNGSQITFSGAAGQALLIFDRQSDGGWRASDAAGRELTLAPAGPAQADPLPGGLTDDPVALASNAAGADSPIVQLTANTVSAKASASASVKEMAGRYAVMRGDRDTGCMVTLEPDARGKGNYRARLAPACRDQGIIVFDPITWQPKGPDLVLTARKGHSVSLEKDPSGVWVKMPKDVKALGLKPL